MGGSGSKIVIVGIGDDGLAGLTEPARRTVERADVLLGAPATLRLLGAEVAGRRVPLDADMPTAVRQVREALAARNPVLISGGDPLFYGVTRYLTDRLGKERFEVIPHVSSMQLAFARVKESWEDAYLTNLVGRPIEAVVDRIRTAEKVGLFSSDEHPPRRSPASCWPAASTTSAPTSARTSARPTSGSPRSRTSTTWSAWSSTRST